MNDITVQGVASRRLRPLYWSVRREIWENRSIYLAPLIVFSIVLFASMIGVLRLGRKIMAVPAGDVAKLHAVAVAPFTMAPAPIMLATFLVGVYYCLDALHGERRDRSLLFWKSLPVSDGRTVLSKALIPLLVLPAIALALSVTIEIILLLFATMVLPGSGVSPAIVWRKFVLVEEVPVMFYGMAIHTLWFAPIYGWLLLVSAWARRAPVLWAVLPLFLIGVVERLALQSTNVAAFLRYRVIGAMARGFDTKRTAGITSFDVTPARFISTPGLWLGLLFAALCVLAAVRLRRSRDPA